ncbi:MAG: pyridoxamine 5'-phosphate oxidase family protein [Thiolinea sp.]
MTQASPPSLQQLHTETWHRLCAAAETADDTLHYLSLSTVDHDGHPQSRLLVLRAVNSKQLTLEFHTDIRSQKWAELQAKPQLTVLGYAPETRLQLRLKGNATLYAPDSKLNQAAWNQLSGWTRHSYCGGPPGLELTAPDTQEILTAVPDEAETACGQSFFGVIRVKVQSLDWFQHPRGQLRRALIEYSEDGSLLSARWIQP